MGLQFERMLLAHRILHVLLSRAGPVIDIQPTGTAKDRQEQIEKVRR